MAKVQIHTKQLSMVIDADTVRGLSSTKLSDEYTLRGYEPGDEDTWIPLVNMGQFSSVWDVAKFEAYLGQHERKEGSRVVVNSQGVVAATFASVQEHERNMGRLDFVVSHPDQRGQGLGRVVCTEVSRYLVDRGYTKIILFTDDWRLPAIGLYLSMGFEPLMAHDDMQERWDTVLKTLNARH
jgi:mycothiol synthase